MNNSFSRVIFSALLAVGFLTMALSLLWAFQALGSRSADISASVWFGVATSGLATVALAAIGFAVQDTADDTAQISRMLSEEINRAGSERKSLATKR